MAKSPKMHDHALVLQGDELVPDMGGPVDLVQHRMDLDRQIATAKAYPRSETACIGVAKRLVQESEEIAQSCIYTLPRSNKLVTGPSVRFAEVMAYAWGNSRFGAKVIDEQQRFIVAQGFYHDLERNIAVVKNVARRIEDSDGRRYNIDMIGVTAMAAMSIALRNAILNGGIPAPIWIPVYDTAAAVLGGAAKPLPVRRALAVERFVKLGIPAERVLARIGMKRIEDIEQEQIVQLRGLAQSIKDEVLTLEQAFPDPAARAAAKAAGNKVDVGKKLRDGKAGKTGGKAPAGETAAPAAQAGAEAADAAPATSAPPEEADAATGDAGPAEEASVEEGMANIRDALAGLNLNADEQRLVDEIRAAVSSAPADRDRIAKEFGPALATARQEVRDVAGRILGPPNVKAL